VVLLEVLLKKKKKSYAGLVEQLQEGHGPFCNPSPRKLRERLLSPGKPGLVASTMYLTGESWVGISPTHLCYLRLRFYLYCVLSSALLCGKSSGGG
jgi:hypothetical protein